MHLNLNPISVLLAVFLFSLFAFSTLFYLAEVGIKSDEYNRFEKFGNAAWVASQNLLSAGISGLEVPKSHVGKLINVFANITGVVILCLFVIACNNMSKLNSYEMELFKRSKQKNANMKDRELIREANYVIKNWILLRYLRAHDKELDLRARISMEFVAAKDRFRALRRKAYLKEPAADVLTS